MFALCLWEVREREEKWGSREIAGENKLKRKKTRDADRRDY